MQSYLIICRLHLLHLILFVKFVSDLLGFFLCRNQMDCGLLLLEQGVFLGVRWLDQAVCVMLVGHWWLGAVGQVLLMLDATLRWLAGFQIVQVEAWHWMHALFQRKGIGVVGRPRLAALLLARILKVAWQARFAAKLAIKAL